MSQARPGARFGGLRIDRVEDRREDLDWLRCRWAEARLLLLNPEGDALADAGGHLRALESSAFREDAFARACFLGIAEDGRPWFSLSLVAGEACPGEAPAWLGLRRAAADWPDFASGLYAYARAVALWRERSRFCGRCGAPTLAARGGHTARCGDASCGLEQFPRLDPAVIVLVTDGERCLLGRQAGWPARQYSTLAGFVEPGESLEDALHREVGEEAGVRLCNVRYQASQPWPFPCSLMVGFRAEASDASIRLGDELEDARWFQVDALLEAIACGDLRASSPISISFRLLRDWIAELRGEQGTAVLDAAACTPVAPPSRAV